MRRFLVLALAAALAAPPASAGDVDGTCASLAPTLEQVQAGNARCLTLEMHGQGQMPRRCHVNTPGCTIPAGVTVSGSLWWRSEHAVFGARFEVPRNANIGWTTGCNAAGDTGGTGRLVLEIDVDDLKPLGNATLPARLLITIAHTLQFGLGHPDTEIVAGTPVALNTSAEVRILVATRPGGIDRVFHADQFPALGATYRERAPSTSCVIADTVHLTYRYAHATSEA